MRFFCPIPLRRQDLKPFWSSFGLAQSLGRGDSPCCALAIFSILRIVFVYVPPVRCTAIAKAKNRSSDTLMRWQNPSLVSPSFAAYAVKASRAPWTSAVVGGTWANADPLRAATTIRPSKMRFILNLLSRHLSEINGLGGIIANKQPALGLAGGSHVSFV
jgi:hypothetical protein